MLREVSENPKRGRRVRTQRRTRCGFVQVRRGREKVGEEMKTCVICKGEMKTGRKYCYKCRPIGAYLLRIKQRDLPSEEENEYSPTGKNMYATASEDDSTLFFLIFITVIAIIGILLATTRM